MPDHAGAPGRRSWSTVDVDVRDAFEYWREEICRTFVPLRPSPIGEPDTPFQGRVDSRALGLARLSVIRAAPQAVVRDPADGDDVEGTWFVNLQTRGVSSVTQLDRRSVLRPGDAVILHARMPYRMTFPSAFEQICIRLSDWYVREAVGQFEHIRGRVLRSSPLTGLLCSYAASVVDHWDAGSAEPASLMALAHVTGLLRTAVASGVSPPADNIARTVRVLLEIRARHREPDLAASAVARRLGMSERTLHASLEPTGMTFGQHLRVSRVRTVEEARAEPDCTVLSAAHLAGFSDVSSYYRARRTLEAGVWR